jgi:cell division protein FtsI (penicillin-binding protein 3)/stage V sporulation protein D (sporulation-specific penicillin-binding protein)
MIASGVVGIIFTGFSARLIELQVVKHEEYTQLAAQKHSIRLTVPAHRGMILDRNGEILAANIPVRKVVVDGSHVKKPGALATLAAPYLGIPRETLLAELRTRSKYKVLLPELDEEKAMALQRAMDEKSLRGLYFHQNTTRTYPNGPLLSHVLGFLGRKDPKDEFVVGVEGIERSMEDYLKGIDGFRHIERDRTGREIVIYRGQEQAPRHGMNVQLTIDMNLQAILEAELDNAFRELKPDNATGIIVDPNTGEILAMTSRPSFNLNQIDSAKPEEMKNRAIFDMVEPGSTFKIVVASAALTERVVSQKSIIYCENGAFSYGGRILRDHHGYGQMSVHDILMKSSNIGSAKMALMLGDEKFYEYVRRFGFGERSGIALPGEIPGLVHPPSRWDRLTITRMPMGQAVAVTPLQLAMGMSVIANGGKLMRPQIIKSIQDRDGQEILSIKPEVIREVIPTSTAKFVSAALTEVVSERGTAALARVSGFSVAGKTGTAQKVDPKGGYAAGQYIVSFVGYIPAEEPRFVCLIIVDNAKLTSGLNYGGLVAAPIFSRVAEKAARYLDLVPAPAATAALPVALGQSGATKFRQ